MRVLVATDSFPPKIDGVADTASVMCEALSARGHHVTVIAPGPGLDSERGAHVLRLAALPLPLYPEVRVVREPLTLRRYAQRLDVQAAVVLTLGPVGLGVAGWLPRETRLIHVYTTDMPGYLRAYRAGFLAPVIDEVTRRVGRRADVTLCPTPVIRDGLVKAGVPKLEIWGRGVDTSLFHAGRRSDAMRRRLSGGEPERPIVLYVGRLAKEKRLLDLLAATRRVPEARFAFVGDGPQRAELERLFPAERTVFTGYLRGTALAEAFASADVFAFPSDSDTFAQVVLQSMASGVPPVVVAGSAPAVLVRAGESGLHVAARSPHAMADAIERLVVDRPYGVRLGEWAATDARARSWDVLMDELEERLYSGTALPGGSAQPSPPSTPADASMWGAGGSLRPGADSAVAGGDGA
ncbi:MAG: glycosyltransferase [Dehalococcoidia bacterium]